MKLINKIDKPGIYVIMSKNSNSSILDRFIDEKRNEYNTSIKSCIYWFNESNTSKVIIFQSHYFDDNDITSLKEWIDSGSVEEVKRLEKIVIIFISLRDQKCDSIDKIWSLDLIKQIPMYFIYNIKSKYFNGKAILELEEKEIYPEWITKLESEEGN